MSAINSSSSSPPSSSTSSSNPSTAPFRQQSAQILSFSSRTTSSKGELSRNTTSIAMADAEEFTVDAAEDDDAEEKLIKASSKIGSPSTVIFMPANINNNNLTNANDSSNSTTTNDTSAIINGSSNNNSFIVSLNQRLNGARHWWNGTAPTTTNDNPLLKKTKDVELFWRNLSYDVARFRWANYVKAPCSVAAGYENRRLLDSISGSIRSGELIAIMGPSGAGKTTLIECISGRRKIGVSGQIVVSGGGKRTKLAYNAQDDSLMPCLTVYETLLFASQLRNYQRNNRLKVKLVDDNDNVYNATTYPDSDLIIR